MYRSVDGVASFFLFFSFFFSLFLRRLLGGLRLGLGGLWMAVWAGFYWGEDGLGDRLVDLGGVGFGVWGEGTGGWFILGSVPGEFVFWIEG